METALTEFFGLEFPIIQAPMAGVSTPALAAAVSNAGGLGSVALGALQATAARAALEETLGLTDRPFAANLFVHPTPRLDSELESRFLAAMAPAFESVGATPPAKLDEIYLSFNDDDDMLEVLLDLRPAVVSLHFGMADIERMRLLKEADIRILATATSVQEAAALEASGVDALVLQGYDAGGHSGAFLGAPDPATAGRDGLLGLIRSVAASTRLPLVAAGGLMHGDDIWQIMCAGAAGAQLGTAFIDCPESLASDAYRRALRLTPGTRLTATISGRPARGLDNALMEWATSLETALPDYPLTYDGVKQLIAVTPDPFFSVMWAGAGSRRARAAGAADLITMLCGELAEKLP